MKEPFTVDDLAEIETRYMKSSACSRSYDVNPWQVAHDLDGFLVASLGSDGEDGKDYYVVTKGVHASELRGGAKADAEFIANAPRDMRRLALAWVDLFNENEQLRNQLRRLDLVLDGQEKP